MSPHKKIEPQHFHKQLHKWGVRKKSDRLAECGVPDSCHIAQWTWCQSPGGAAGAATGATGGAAAGCGCLLVSARLSAPFNRRSPQQAARKATPPPERTLWLNQHLHPAAAAGSNVIQGWRQTRGEEKKVCLEEAKVSKII